MALSLALLISFFITALSVYLGLFAQRYATILTDMQGMVIGMMLGMMTGLLVGYAFGASGNLFIANLVGMGLGVACGIGFGRLGGLPGMIEGGMAGVVGGMLGAMLGSMLAFSTLALWTTGAVLAALFAATLAGALRMVASAANDYTVMELRLRIDLHTRLAPASRALIGKPYLTPDPLSLSNALFFRALSKQTGSADMLVPSELWAKNVPVGG